MRQYWVAPVPPFQDADGTALASSTALTDVSPLPANIIAANQLEKYTALEVEAFGEFSNTGTPTLLIGVYFGGVAGVALAACAATATAAGVTGVPWKLTYRGRVRAIGSAGSIVGQGVLELGTSLTALTPIPIPATKAARTVAIDTTTAKAVTIGAQWGTSNAANTLTVNEILVKLIN